MTPPERARAADSPPPGWLLWTSFLAAPMLWFAYFMLAYVYNEVACGFMQQALSGLDGASPNALLLISTVAVTLGCAGLTVLAWRVGRRVGRTNEPYDDLFPKVGFLMGLLVTFVMLAHLLQVVMIGACA